MTRPRKSLPGRLSLFDLLPPPGAVQPEPTPRPCPAEPVAQPQIVDGACVIPIRPDETTLLQWYCASDGSCRNALAVLHATIFRDGAPVAIVCPIFGQRWDAVRDYGWDCVDPFYRALYPYVATQLGIPEGQFTDRAHLSVASQNETRPELRGEQCRSVSRRLAPHQPKPKSEPPRPEPASEALAVVEPAQAVPEPESPAEIEPPYLEHGVLRLPRRPDGATQANWRCYIHPDGSYRDAVVILYRIGYAANVPISIQCPALDCRWDASRDFVRDCAVPFYAAADAHAAGLLDLSASEAGALAYLTMAYSQETRPILRNVGHFDETRPTLPAREAA